MKCFIPAIIKYYFMKGKLQLRRVMIDLTSGDLPSYQTNGSNVGKTIQAFFTVQGSKVQCPKLNFQISITTSICNFKSIHDSIVSDLRFLITGGIWMAKCLFDIFQTQKAQTIQESKLFFSEFHK